ncbi:HsdR family type I site-specific deoxyribonuclease [Candidatus Bathyarchaeota archaeon A05DMB-2]|nr:HsdR family type I site-specific deoxyribonuclease [Candidatus Bathyarchaeota archaeon A05DMB-2]
MQEKGWRFVSADNLERESLEEPLLTPVLIRALKRLNADIGIGDEEIKQVVNELKLKTSGAEYCKQILNNMKDGILIKFEKEREVKRVKLFDYDNINNNEFIVSRQVIHQSGDKQIRNDIILYINGIPTVNIECKNPTSLTENWYTTYKQIQEYQQTVPEPYKYIQIGVAAEQTARYFSTAPWQKEDVKIHQWRTPDKPDPLDAQTEMLTPQTLLNIIRNYTFFRIEHGATTKVITRYMQYQAAEKIYNRVTAHLQGKTDKNKGLIWHWQGSGKTLTMIFAANKLYKDPQLENPTIFFIVDREELQEQLYQEFTALYITKPETVDTINTLRQILRHDENRGKRGIFITLIHKFRPEELTQLQNELNAISQTQTTIQNRKNVILFIDEAHRTQYGILASQMKQTLKNALAFALTGTPIAKPARDTYQEFSYPPEETYLDKYFITDSIQDGFTLPIAYQPRLEKDVHLKKELLDTFIQVEFEEIPEEYREKTEERIKQKLNAIKVFLENPERIKLVTQDIAQHFKENLDGKFKALVVAVNRLACVRYKRELDKHLPKEYSEVVMTFTRTDPQEIQDYQKELTTRYHGKDIEDTRKQIIDNYKEQDYPKILIVTDMLLTGFDVPILQTIYLDKPLKEHRLLQAIARTNRPYKDIKEAGLIIDYVGILKEFTKAFENYTKEDIQGVLLDLNTLTQEFTQLIDQTTALFQDIPKDQDDRQTMLKAFETITTNEQNAKKFQQNYRHLRKLFELLGTQPIKLQKLKEYTWLTQVYDYYIHWLRQERYEEYRYVPKYFPKTLKYVYKTTQLADIEKQYPTIQFDADYLKNLQEKIKTKQEKAANILFTLNRFIIIDKHRNPIYETLTQKVERILKLWKEKTKDYEKIYNQAAQIVNEIQQLQTRQKQLAFTDLQYAILLTLEQKLPQSKDLTTDVQELTKQLQPQLFKGWQTQQTTRKTIERETRKYLRKYIKQHGLSLANLDELHQKIMESVKTYG